MTIVRPLERADVPAAARLFSLVWRGGADASDTELERFFTSTLLDHPWADAELPSFVAADGDEIVGFIGSNVRRMTFDGTPLRMVCSAHLVSHPRVRSRAVGARLMKTLLAGAQDITITDGATEDVRRMWEAFGGHMVDLGAFSFVRVFRPWALAAELVETRRSLRRASHVIRGVAGALDQATRLVAGARLTPDSPSGVTEALTPELVVEHVGRVASGARLRAAYDEPYLNWLFDELRRVETRGTLWADGFARGRLIGELVRGAGGVEGWYLCHVRRGGLCRVLQFVATPRGADAVFSRLSHRAYRQGAVAVHGRLEPRLVGPVTALRCIVRPGEGRLLVHARDPAVASVARSADALLTRMDGEWW